MALLPKPFPKWADTPYGGDPGAWAEAKAQCMRTLAGWAASRRYGFYSDLVKEVTAVPWPEGAFTHRGAQVGTLLGQLVLDQLDPLEDRPIISALVVSKEANLPSAGFWKLCSDLGVYVPDSDESRVQFWLQEIARCWEWYGGLAGPK